jgi:pseudouridine-5'-phosphate glycosidase/pseudouridine kinase
MYEFLPFMEDSIGLTVDQDHGHTLELTNGTFFGCPIPEKYAVIGDEIQRAVDQAVAESEVNGIAKSGKAVTPWLLNRVYELTGGLSLENSSYRLPSTELVQSNADSQI